jgi:hypothetical protein
MNITVSQTMPLANTLPKLVTNPVIKPLMQGPFLEEMPLTTTMQEFLFKVTKDSHVFWVGAAVPLGTLDFTKIQVFFHPTVQQGLPPHVVVHAREEDYPTFTGGWSGSLQRYVAMEGGQLAGARLVPLIVPFTTMAALGNPSMNVFGVDPVATLAHLAAAIQSAMIPVFTPPPPEVQQVGVTSFSSGITALRQFVHSMQPSGLLREIIDLDSPFIIGQPADLVRSPGAVSSCYTQTPRATPLQGYVHLPPARFTHLTSFNADPHACIGWMMYFTAMLSSVIQ